MAWLGSRSRRGQFLLYTSNDCTGSGAAVATGPAEGTGTRSVDTGSLAAGDYSFKASLADNSNYLGDDSDCEPFKVAKAQLTAATVVHDPTHAAVTNGSPAALGTKVHDLETTSGGVAGFAEPAPTFLLYTSNDCTGSGAAVATGAAEGRGRARSTRARWRPATTRSRPAWPTTATTSATTPTASRSRSRRRS